MTREEYEAAIARNRADLDAEKARVFAGRVPGVGLAPDPAKIVLQMRALTKVHDLREQHRKWRQHTLKWLRPFRPFRPSY